MPTPTDYELILARFKKFLSLLERKARENRPAYSNAANGHFRSAVWHSRALKDCLEAPPLVTAQGRKVWKVFHWFMKSVRNDFGNNDNHAANWLGSFQALKPFLDDVGDEAAGVVVAIVRLLGSDEDSDAEQQSLAEAIADLMEALEDTEATTSGKHANGHIADEMYGTAKITLREIDDLTGVSSSQLKKLLRALAIYCRALKKLPEGDGVHAPWLRAEWQVGFEAVTLAALTGVRRLAA